MANDMKPQLTDEEKIERKARLFKRISRILIVVSIVVIAVFIYFAVGTKQNIDEQTSIDTKELRSKLIQIINLENKYFKENSEYVQIKFFNFNKKIPNYDPNISGNFKYMFDPETGIATGQEKDGENDVNGDIDGNDGLTLSVKWEPGVVKGSKGGNFFWPDEEINDLKRRAANQ